MTREERELRDYINGKTRQAEVYPPTVRKMITAMRKAIYEEICYAIDEFPRESCGGTNHVDTLKLIHAIMRRK